MTLYAVGDVQGCADEFDKLLSKISFRKKRDHLWLVGDLVNRGPDSRAVLRMVIKLGDSATCVLGNHDLHLLATYAGVRDPIDSDTFEDVLHAKDAGTLISWLRHRPLGPLSRTRLDCRPHRLLSRTNLRGRCIPSTATLH